MRARRHLFFKKSKRGNAMKILAQIFVLFGLCMVGNLASGYSPVPIPGSVISMLLVLALLYSGWLKQEKIAGLSSFLQKNMIFLFIPAGVGLIAELDVLKSNLFGFVAVGVLSAIITFVVTGFVVGAASRLLNGRNKQ